MRALLYSSVKHAKVCFGLLCIIAFEKLARGRTKFLFGRTSREIFLRFLSTKRGVAEAIIDACVSYSCLFLSRSLTLPCRLAIIETVQQNEKKKGKVNFRKNKMGKCEREHLS